MTEEDLYVRLGNRLNRNSAKMPLIDPVLNFLRDVFPKEQAELGAAFPMGAHSLRSLSRLLHREKDELERLLEEMADEGLIFVSLADGGEREFSLSPFVPGIIEFQYVKGEDTEKVRRRNRLLQEIHKAMEARLEKRYQDPDPAKKKPGFPGLRTIAVEERLPDDTAAATWEQMAEIIDRERSFAVVACPCRVQAKLNGNPCRLTDAPRDSCIYFGKVADFMVDRHFARRLSRDELLKLLEACEDAGLVHNINNFLGDNIVLCNCCGCCCSNLLLMKKFRGIRRVLGSNFVVTVDKESCIGCGACADRCQMGALTMEDDIVVADRELCLGCGNCVTRCPVESLSLVRCANNEPPPRDTAIVGLGV